MRPGHGPGDAVSETPEQKPHILVCDDETGVRESLRLILDGPYRVSFVTNGEEAVEFVKTRDPAAVVMDIKMPKMNGLDALAQIKKLKPAVRVMMITGYESDDVAAQAMRLGADDYVTKPFERQKIQAKVQALLNRPKV